MNVGKRNCDAIWRRLPVWLALVGALTCAASLPAASAEAAGGPQVSAGISHTLAIKANGTLWSWGDNSYGQLGRDGDPAVPGQIGTATDWVAAACGDEHSVALNSAGEVWVWGSNDMGQLGLGLPLGDIASTPQRLGADTDWADVDAGGLHSMGRKADGRMYVWGNNRDGELGIGLSRAEAEYRDTPQEVASTWAAMKCTGYHMFAVKPDLSIWSWGDNTSSQAGQPGLGSVNTPTLLTAPTAWDNLGTGRTHSWAVDLNGDLWLWGDNVYGQLGLGTNADLDRATPQEIAQAGPWVSVTGGQIRGLAVRFDGSLWAWGTVFGDAVIAPTQLPGTDTWVAASGDSTVLRSDGEVYLWGGDPAQAPSAVGINLGTDAAAPTAIISPDPAGGPYDSIVQVTIRTRDNLNDHSVVHYTTDGTAPTSDSPVFPHALTLTQSTTLKFFAQDASGNSSNTQTASFTVKAASDSDSNSGGVCFIGASAGRLGLRPLTVALGALALVAASVRRRTET